MVCNPKVGNSSVTISEDFLSSACQYRDQITVDSVRHWLFGTSAVQPIKDEVETRQLSHISNMVPGI